MKRPNTKDDWHKRTVFLDQVDSTNTYALELVRRSRPEHGTVVFTEYQTSGRGQRGRTWEANKGQNALFSVIYYPTGLAPADHFKLNKIVSVSLFEAISELVSADFLSIKWPNDLYFDDRKVAGMLIQNVIRGKEIDHTVIGLGINVNQERFPGHLVKATSLSIITGMKKVPLEVTRKIVDHLDEEMNNFDQARIDDVYSANLYLKGKKHTFRSGGLTFTGEIRGVDDEGRLIIDKEGKLEKFAFGDIEYS
ncbi:MAG: biotin--[acetyl-CoA-carboxylase] ligase [Saprospiraceae bacterium]|nr:biotin--[acetyl-CoA-carboxylase] ligase [Saprospiraceae bacterium]